MSGRTQTLKKFVYRWGLTLPVFAVGGYGSWSVGAWAGESLARRKMQKRKQEYAEMEERVQKRSEEMLRSLKKSIAEAKRKR